MSVTTEKSYPAQCRTSRGPISVTSTCPAVVRQWRFQLVLATLLIVLSTSITRWYSLSVYEVDWDESNRMSIGASLNHGHTLYVDAWDHHTFLDILVFQQLFRVFSPSMVPRVIHGINILAVSAISVLVYLLIREGTSSFIAALFGSSLALQLFPHEFFRSSNGELYHSLTSVTACAIYCLGRRRWLSLMTSGALLAAGFCVKQTAIFDIAAFGVLHWLVARRRKDCAYRYELARLGIGAGLVFAGSIVYFLAHGSLGDAFYATFLDAFIYATGCGLQDTLSRYESTFGSELRFFLGMHWIILASLGAAYLGLFAPEQDARRGLFGRAAVIWFCFVFVGITSIGRFYHHYFIQLITPLALACAYGIALIPNALRAVPVILCVILYTHPYLYVNPSKFSFFESLNMSEIAKVAEIIRSKCSPESSIFLYHNSALCLYFLTERFPPTTVFMDEQMTAGHKDGPRLLKQGLRGWEKNPPKVVVTGSLSYGIPAIDELIERDYVFCTNIGVYGILTRRTSDTPKELSTTAPPKP